MRTWIQSRNCTDNCVALMKFTGTKSETLNLRVSSEFKNVLKEVADREHRSMVNMLEVLLADYCDRNHMSQLRQEANLSVSKRAHVEQGAEVGVVA